MPIATRVRVDRSAAGLSRSELARRAQISDHYPYEIEAGRHRPGMKAALRLAGELNVPVDCIARDPAYQKPEARAAEVMQDLTYLEELAGQVGSDLGNLRLDTEAADYNLHGQGVVPGYLSDIAPRIQGTDIAINTGMAYVQDAHVHYDTLQGVESAGKAADTCYVLLDSAGNLTAETAETSTRLTQCSVVWNGSAMSNLVDRRSFIPRPWELKKLYGTSPSVTAAAFNELPGGGQTSLYSHVAPEGSPVNAKAASGTITFTGQVADGETVTIGGQAYRFKDSSAQAYDVKIGATKEETADNLKRAINDEGVEGTNYGTGTAPHATVAATVNGAIVIATAKIKGAAGNSIALAKSAANITRYPARR